MMIIIVISILLVVVMAASATAKTKEVISGSSRERDFSESNLELIRSRWGQFAELYEYFWNIPRLRILAHIAVESGGDPRARGASGDTGLMQVTRVAYDDVVLNFPNLPVTPAWDTMLDPSANIAIGTGYLALSRRKLKGDLNLASQAYNVGYPRVRLDNSAGKGYLALVLKAESKLQTLV